MKKPFKSSSSGAKSKMSKSSAPGGGVAVGAGAGAANANAANQGGSNKNLNKKASENGEFIFKITIKPTNLTCLFFSERFPSPSPSDFVFRLSHPGSGSLAHALHCLDVDLQRHPRHVVPRGQRVAVQMDQLHQGLPEAMVRAQQRTFVLLPHPGRNGLRLQGHHFTSWGVHSD